MKQKLLLSMLLTLLVSLLPFGKASAQEAYAHYDNNGTFTFYYDNNRSSRSGVTFDLNEGYEPPLWRQIGYDDVYQGVTHVVFDASFADARPTTTCLWFDTMINLTSITGMAEYLNTSEVTSMQSMFAFCDKLTTIDVSNFDTSKVTDMGRMFFLCGGVTDLDLSNFDTRNVTTMGEMFNYCESLTSLDLHSFNTESVMNMNSMFESCLSLKNIIVGDGWSTYNVTESERMFIWCYSLVGGRGTVYDENHIDSSYAHIDGGPSDPGYLSPEPSDGPYAVYADGTLTFYYDKARLSHSGYSFDLNENGSDPAWLSFADAVTKVVFDPSFADYHPSTTQSWFSGMKNLTTIEGMYDYLVTYEVSDMRNMFYECESLTELDLGGFNTQSVRNMYQMFRYCERLTTIYVASGWYVDRVSDSRNMFNYCLSLVGGMGTVYDDVYVDKTYAHIDGGPSNPGYLTAYPEPYAIFKNGTLTLYYDGNYNQRDGKYFYIHDGQYDQRWRSDYTYQDVTNVVFDPSFKGYHPTSMYRWFYDMSRLQSITGMKEYLNTSQVETMRGLFYYCQKLDSLDLSNFDTRNVWDMGYMFSDCERLKHLDLSSFNTKNVIDMTAIFARCYALETIDMSNFDTYNVTKMIAMFRNCQSLTSLDLSKFDTRNVTDMTAMFDNCSQLTTLDLSKFITNRVKQMNEMFAYCNQLTTILVSDIWSTDSLFTSDDMFRACFSLVGAMGTPFDASHTDATYACIDGRYGPGYLTGLEAYAVYDGKGKLTFRYDNNRSTCTDKTYPCPFPFKDPEWVTDGTNALVDTVAFDSSFYYARLMTARQMFCGMENLKEIVDMALFYTDEVTDMSEMFAGCRSLKEVYLAPYAFNTSRVTNMYAMFANCNSLTSIDLSNFDTRNVVYMSAMFEGCTALTDLDLRSFDTQNVTDMAAMFSNCCRNITALDLTSFNTHNVTMMLDMFRSNGELEQIYVGDEWSTTNVMESRFMFEGCSNLVGIEGTTYDPAHTDAAYAHIDGGTSNPGYLSMKPYAEYDGDGTLTFYYDKRRKERKGTTYDVNGGYILPGWYVDNTANDVTTVVFSPSFSKARPTSTYGWFANMTDLTKIRGMAENLNTSNVTNMYGMFLNCSRLENIDLSAFDTRRVNDMGAMFYWCTNLKSLDLSTFLTHNVTDMGGMFFFCWSLTELDLSRFNTSNVLSMEDMFCACDGLTSLDLYNFDTHNVKLMDYMFSDCTNLKDVYVGSFDTRNVLDMSSMFALCPSLGYLDLSSFDTRKVMFMDGMFYSDEQLSTILVGSGWSTASVYYSKDMFYGCENLVGGAGTVYDEKHTGAKYARIDGGPSNPGYLTGAFLPGDVNNDGQVGIGDIVAITNVMAGIETDSGTVSRADVNADNQVGIGDIVAVTNIMAGVE